MVIFCSMGFGQSCSGSRYAILVRYASEDLPPRGAGGRNLELRAKGSGTSQRPVWPKSGVTATMNRKKKKRKKKKKKEKVDGPQRPKSEVTATKVRKKKRK